MTERKGQQRGGEALDKETTTTLRREVKGGKSTRKFSGARSDVCRQT